MGGLHIVDPEAEEVLPVGFYLRFGLCKVNDQIYCICNSQRHGSAIHTYHWDGDLLHAVRRLEFERLLLSWDVHDMKVVGEKAYIAATRRNRIMEIDLKAGAQKEHWIVHPEESGDTCHANSIWMNGPNDIYVSMFSYDERPKTWAKWKKERRGRIWRKVNGEVEVLYEDLHQPHSLFMYDGDLFYCESYSFTVCCNGETLFEIEGYPRGLLVTDDYIYVGQSQSTNHPDSRFSRNSEPAGVWIVSRDDFDDKDFIPMRSSIDSLELEDWPTKRSRNRRNRRGAEGSRSRQTMPLEVYDIVSL